MEQPSTCSGDPARGMLGHFLGFRVQGSGFGDVGLGWQFGFRDAKALVSSKGKRPLTWSCCLSFGVDPGKKVYTL